MTISQNILFTGAGFTHNFGGFLADDIWAEIFNHPEIQNRQSVKDKLLEDFDYESIYYTILHSSNSLYTEPDRNAIKSAVLDAYKNLDQLIINSYHNKHDPNRAYATKKLIDRFSENTEEPGFFFTLNQDIFIERFYQSSKKPLVLPGMRRIPDPGSGMASKSELEDNDFITVPSEVKILSANQLSNQELHYIKLHGSFNWKSSDGSNKMVIGKDKEEMINREPLLKWYANLFREALFEKNRRLLVIGYSFRDRHINEIISTAIKDAGLKLYVVSMETPREFVDKLSFGETIGCPLGEEILKGLSGYFPYRLIDVLVGDQFRMLNKYYFLEPGGRPI